MSEAAAVEQPAVRTREVQFDDLFKLVVEGAQVRLDIADEFSSVTMSVEDALRLATLLVKAAQSADPGGVAELVAAQREATAVQRSSAVLG